MSAGDLFSMFEHNAKAEAEKGIALRLGNVRIRIVRAGGANDRYKKRLNALTKQYRYLIDNDQMDEKVSEDIMRRVYAETIVLGWETLEVENGVETWKPYVKNKEGVELSFSVENVIELFKALPNLFNVVQREATKAANFLAATEEADAKN